MNSKFECFNCGYKGQIIYLIIDCIVDGKEIHIGPDKKLKSTVDKDGTVKIDYVKSRVEGMFNSDNVKILYINYVCPECNCDNIF